MNSETHISSLDVLIIYDSVRSGKRAKDLCDRLAQRLPRNCRLNLSVWSLSALQLPTLAQAAAGEAEHAALLIVAVNGDETFPRHVKTFLHRCARAIHAADGALVAQFHSILKMNEELCPAYGCLKQIAHHTGLRFFSEVVAQPEEELDRSSAESLRASELRPRGQFRRQGLNPGPKTILKQFLNQTKRISFQ